MIYLPRYITFFSAIFLAISALSANPRQEWLSSLRQFLHERYPSIEASPISTGILYDLVLPMSGIEALNGSDTSGVATLRQWRQVAHELRRASLEESPLPSHTAFRVMGRQAAREHIHPLAILYYHYEHIRPGLAGDSVFRFDQQKIIAMNEDAFEQTQVFAATPLHAVTYRGAETRFQIDLGTLFFSNDPRPVKKLEIDFDDGRGYRQIGAGETTVRYSSVGTKTLRVRVILSDGTQLSGRSVFQVLSLRTPTPNETWQLQAAIPFNGEFAGGEAYVYLADGHSVPTNPVIVVEGFDINNSMNWDELYALLNQQDLLETIRAMGYDAVVLNYGNAITHIQSNAFLVEALIDSVNDFIAPNRTSVLIGASMGGLTTRYGLTHMEANSHPHRIRTWISFDSPHTGANIPLGIQYWVDFFAESSADAAFLRDALNSPAPRQMLLTHFTSPPSNVAGSDPLFGEFLSDLAQLGDYPSLPRRVAVANGSGYQQGMDFSPGNQLILYEYRSWYLDLTGNVWALHNSQPQLVFDGEENLVWPFPDRYMSVTVQPTWPWDNAPGGMRSTMAGMDSVPAPYGDIIALHPNHCFIPAISALGLTVSDPFYNIAGDPNPYDLTSFDSLYFPVENQGHVELTPDNFWWFLQEAVDSLPAPVVVIQTANDLIDLHWQPVTRARSYRIYATEDLSSWPQAYALTADTTWTDDDASPLLKFYQVKASFEAAGSPSVSQR